MSNLRTIKVRDLFKRHQLNDAFKRESQQQEKAKESHGRGVGAKPSTVSGGYWSRTSLVLDDENNLGPEYEFLISAPSLRCEDDAQGQLMTLTDLLNEIATVDQTLENNLLFTQYIDEDSQLFDVIYDHEGPDTDTAGLFGDLGTIFNLALVDQEASEDPNLGYNKEELQDTHGLGLSRVDTESIREQDKDAENSLIWPNIPEADDSCDEEKSLSHSFDTTDETMLCTHNCMLIAGGRDRYVFTLAEREHGLTEYVGRKRNVE